MDCRHVSTQLSAYLDDELAPAERQAVADHLRSCPQCAEELRGLSLVAAHVQAFPVPPLAPDFAARVMAQLPDHRPQAISRWVGLLPIGAALLMATLAWAVWRPLLRLWWVVRGLARGLYHLVTSGLGAAPGWNAALILAGAVLLVGSWLAIRGLASSAWREETT